MVADSALHRSRVNHVQLRDVLVTCRSWPGSDTARCVIDLADGRAESPLETLGRLLIQEHGLPPPEPQFAVADDFGVFAYADLAWPDARVIVEFDGMLKYDGREPQALRREKQRQERIERLGWIVVRLTWHDITREQTRTVARLRDALARGAGRR